MERALSERLDLLNLKVLEYKAGGFVRRWPEEVRREALFLVKACGYSSVRKRVRLSSSVLSYWMRSSGGGSVLRQGKGSVAQESRSGEIVVSRVDVGSGFFPRGDSGVKVSLKRGGCEVQIFCSELARECVQGVLS